MGGAAAAEKDALAEAQPQRPGYAAVDTSGAATATPEEGNVQLGLVPEEGNVQLGLLPEDGNVLLGLMLSAFAGCVDGLWSSLTLTAKLSGVDNYVAASYFCVGLLVPLAVLETAMYLHDPPTWTANVKRLTLCEWALVALSGFLNIFAVSFGPN
jgi:hypothetical protein